MRGPSGHGPSAHVLGSHAAGLLTGVGDMYADPFTSRWPGYDPAHIGYVFTLTLKPGQTVALMTFVVKGLSEVYDPRGGFPIAAARRAGRAEACRAVRGADAPKIPAAGSEIARVTGDRAAAGRSARPARADAAAAIADRQLARRRQRRRRAVHGGREDGAADPGRADARARRPRKMSCASIWRGCRCSIGTARRFARCSR